MAVCVKLSAQGCAHKGNRERFTEIEIPRKLEVGKTLSFIGIPDKEAREFSILLLTKQGDEALRVHVDFGRTAVNLDYNCDGGSTMSQRLTFDQMSFPFSRCTPFKLGVEVLKDEYKLSVTGQPLAHFAHRVNPESVTMMEVIGDVRTKEMKLE
ncbi:32 kDa beta-galactoside-binding lectin lec-3 [Bulinus truncatus]|nr:32 kDa beta-galactoside-binding lectin lec-3 [Bulinus truncatus]